MEAIKAIKAIPPDLSASFTALLFDKGRLLATNATLNLLIQSAYGVQSFQLLGGPDWASTEKYDVNAKFAETGVSDARVLAEQRRLAFRELLADRFKLAVHNETRQLPMYSLKLSGIPKLRQAVPGDSYSSGLKRPWDGKPQGPGLWTFKQGELVGQGTPMAQLTSYLSLILGRRVQNSTGLKGNFDFTLHWTAGDSASLIGAVSDQLGLQLDPETGPVDVLVIDRAEPAETVAGSSALMKSVSTQAQRPETKSGSGELQDVSIKPLGPATTGSIRERYTVMNGEANFTGTLRLIIKFAYQINDAQLSGGPAWLTTDLYEVTAKVPKGSHFDSALQKVLADRFKLAVHRELKELPAYEMVVGPNGSKLTEPPAEENQHFSITHNPLGHVTGNGVAIHDLAAVIQFQVGRMVIDKTGLNGHYDFTLTVPNWTHPAKTPEDAAPFLKAVSEQLGLELKPTTKFTEVLVIDHVEPVTDATKDMARIR